MKIIWLGQAGLFFETEGIRILVDPYLSDSVARENPGCRRRVAVKEEFFSVTPDLLILTHDHPDHYDPETVSRYLEKEGNITVLSPGSVWDKVRSFGRGHNYVLFAPGTEWTHRGVLCEAVPAAHSDPDAIGVILRCEGKVFYITGDTLYSRKVLSCLPPDIDVVFLPINGAGNNMNCQDGARFARETGASTVVPIHFGLLDDLTADQFHCPGKVIPTIYEEVLI